MRGAIFWVVDQNFLPLAFGAARHLRSISSGDIDLHIFCEAKAVTSGTVEGIRIRANELGASIPTDMPQNMLWPSIVYGRLFALGLLAKEYDRAVYVDADMAFTRSLDPLFSLDFGTALIAAVADPGFISDEVNAHRFRLAAYGKGAGVDPEHYFNSGFFVADLAAIAAIDMRQELTAYMSQYGRSVEMFDQDFLNHLFLDRWLELSPAWNFLSLLLGFGLERAIPPAIVHFTGHVKPWHWRHFPNEPAHMGQYRRILDNPYAASFKTKPVAANRYKIWERQVKFLARAALCRLGVESKRVRRLRAEWQQRRDIFARYYGEALSENRYADVQQGIVAVDPAGITSMATLQPRFWRGRMTVPHPYVYPDPV